MRKLKIAIFEPSRISQTGGAQKVTAKIAEHLSKKHYVELFTQKQPYDFLNFGNTKITLIKPSSRFFASVAFFSKKIKDFDILLVGELPSNFGALRNSPSIYICLSPTRDFYDLKGYYLKKGDLKQKIKVVTKNLLFRKIEELAVKKVTRILAISDNVRKRIKKFYNRDSGILYAGIDFDNFHSGEYKDYILTVSRLVSAKRVDVLIKSMGLVKNKKIRLYIVGEGKDQEEIKRLAKDYPNVNLLGAVEDKELIDLYANCLAVTYIPIDEDWGLVPIEAGASEKATIGADEGGLKETIVDGKTGFLIDGSSPKTIAEKIDYLADNKKIAIKMGKEAKKHTYQFDWKNILPILDKEIEEIIKYSSIHKQAYNLHR